jgi:hypothetical protein
MKSATVSHDAPSPRAPAVGIGWRHPHYAELLETQPALDFIEVHSENFFAPGGAARAVLREGRASYPVSLHGVGLSLGSASGIDEWHLDQLERLVHEIDPVRISDHASFARGVLPGAHGPATVHAADLLPVPFSREALDVMCANVQRVQDRLRRPIAVENLSAYLRWQDADMSETQFLSTLAQRTGCSLLVDVNNIYVNALNAQLLGEPGAPLEACRRMAGPDPRRGGGRDPSRRSHPLRRHRDRRPRQPRQRSGLDAVPARHRALWRRAHPDRMGHRRAATGRAARRGDAGARRRHSGTAADPQRRKRAGGGAGMNALAQQQQALLGTLLALPGSAQAADAVTALRALVHSPWARGLAAYQANGHELAERSLRAAYPVVAALVGGDSFATMACELWHRHPPVRGDLACWGDALPAFVDHNPQLADVPYLADVARVEWALHRAAGAPDAGADPASFALLTQADPATFTLRLAPGTAVVTSDWPVASLVTAHLHEDPSLAVAAGRVQARAAECARVWRQGLRPRIAACTRAERPCCRPWCAAVRCWRA